MDDLISREVAIDAVKHAWAKGLEPSQYIEIIPTVPAVPLETLAEWLADNYEPPANVSNGKALDDHEFCVTLWRYVLQKIMEEQGAAD